MKTNLEPTTNPVPRLTRFVLRTSSAVLVGIFLTFSTTYAITTTSPEKPEGLTTANQSFEAIFNYNIENRPDPFVPFISDKSTSTNITEIVPVAEQLSGMQLFEPGQLNLVAIVMTGENDFAMAEDTTGKGYFLQAGMKIGKRGIITAIETNVVIIEETAFTRAGKKLTSKIVMLLKKEGEE